MSSKVLLCMVLCAALHSVVGTPKVVVYWGQGPDGEKDLKNYCMDSTYDVIVLAFVNRFPSSSGSSLPRLDMAGHCDDPIDGTNLDDCRDSVADDVAYCQSVGKQILISMGGASGNYGFTSDAQAQTFATTMWNLFLGGTHPQRPFGNVILDGIDLDIEGGNTIGYTAFITKLRTYFVGASKPYYIASAPQCLYPDEWLGPGPGTALTSAWFDYVWVQFYNNNCGLDHPNNFNYNTWNTWATTISINPNVKLFVGAPASEDSAGEGYVNAATLASLALSMQAQHPNNFGGVMFWEARTAEENNNFGAQIASLIKGASAPMASPIQTVTTKKLTTHARVTTQKLTTQKATTHAANAVTTRKLTTHAPVSAPVTSSKVTTHAASAPSIPSITTNKVTTNKVTTHAPGSLPSPIMVTTGSGSLPPLPASCTIGHMVCTTSETYRMCDRGVWAAEQHCQVGLTCQPAGNFVYCV